MFKIGILLIIIFNNLLFSMDNIFYFKSYIHPSKKLGNLKNSIKYNFICKYHKVVFGDNVGTFSFYIIPFFQNPINGYEENIFSFYKKRKGYYGLSKKKKLIQNNKYPKLEVKIYNINLFETDKIDLMIQDVKEKNIVKENLKLEKRQTLKDARFDNDSNTMKLGSLIERVVEKAIENQEIYFLKKIFDNKDYDVDIIINDLCYGEARIDSCINDDLYLKLNYGQLKKISSSKLETKPKFSTKKKNHKKLNIKIENIERFKYSDNRYYLYFYNTKESCNKDKGYLSKVNIKESFIEDIGNKKIKSEYKWLKGRSFDKCIEGFVDSEKLKFGI